MTQQTLKGKTVLVTGADGFIGSHLTERLVAEGANVRAFVYYNSFGHWGWLDQVPADTRNAVEVLMGDVRDAERVRQAVDGTEVVLHLAALIGIPYSYVAARSYVDTNVHGTLNVLEAARASGVERVVHTSTSEVYGTAQYVPIDETHPLNAQSPYAASKIAADQMALSYHRSFELPVAVVRPFNTYGPRQSIRAVIPTIIAQVVSGRKRIELGNLTPTRDFNFVGDIAGGFVAAATAERAVGEVVNLGSNFEVSIARTAELIGEVLDRPVETAVDENRIRPDASEVDRLWAANAKAAETLGWRPDHAGEDGLRRGLEVTARWFADPENLASYRDRFYAV
jgi:dTDP-glucose 4,6-dehydratase